MRTFNRAVLGLALLSACALVAPCQAAESDKYIPGQTEAVVTINVKQILAAPLVKNNLPLVQALLAQAGDVKKALDDIGFDPFRDVDSVVLALSQDSKQAVVLINGTFDPGKIQAKAEETAKERKGLLKVSTVGTYTIFEVKPPEQRDTLFVAILDGSVVVASQSKEQVVDALDKKAGKKKSELKKELEPLLRKIDPKQSVSIVALSGALAASGQGLAEKVQHITGGITISDDVKAELVLNTKDVKDAKAIEGELKDGLDQIKNLVELMANQNKEMKPLVDIVGTLKLAADGSSVTLKGFISKEIIGKAISRGQ